MSEWIDIKAEDSVSNFLPSDLPGAEPGVYLPAAEAHLPSSGHSVSLPPDPEHVFQGRPAATPSERQRTVQACDKCRERKTKCSGDHPVCQRCTTRGLICQYSSREPRTRGPSKARLRNAVSSTDLRASSNARSFSHNPQHTQQLLHYDSQVYDTLPDYRSLRRVASIPISFQDEPRGLPIDPTFESYAPPFALNETSTTYHTPPLNYTQPDPRTSQLRDMRRVQSHSTLIGSQRGSLSRNTPSYPSFRSPENFSGQTYGQQWSSQGRISPPSLPLFDTTVDQLLPPAPRVDHATQRRQSPKVHPWGYHSDGSTGSEAMSTDVNIEYSPASSEDVPEPQPSTPFLHYTQGFSDTDAALNMPMSSQNDCTPQFLSPSMFAPGEHFPSDGVAIARPSSESDAHPIYDQYVYH